MTDETAHFLADAPSQPDWVRLGQHLPYEWIAQAVAYMGKARIRKRRQPAEPVAWLVIALALYCQQSISEVVDELDVALPAMKDSFVSKSAVARARPRLGAEPIKALSAISARAWRLGAHLAAPTTVQCPSGIAPYEGGCCLSVRPTPTS